MFLYSIQKKCTKGGFSHSDSSGKMNRYADEINSQLILFNSVLHFKIIPFQNYILHIKSEEGEAGSEDD